jgi:uncharacterized protein YndB with AHSA1/START domain
MTTNTFTITINSTPQKIWHNLTNSDQVSKYMKGMKVVSHWQVGSHIEYTCFDDNGNIVEWNGTKMIWKGIVKEFIPNTMFVVDYSGSPTGITQEKYTLEKLSETQTRVTFEQSATTAEIADGYKEGNQYALNTLKEYSETK